jgi:hypothetical protein
LFAARITGTNSIWLLSIQFGKVCIYEEAQRCCQQNIQPAPYSPKPDTFRFLLTAGIDGPIDGPID